MWLVLSNFVNIKVSSNLDITNKFTFSLVQVVGKFNKKSVAYGFLVRDDVFWLEDLFKKPLCKKKKKERPSQLYLGKNSWMESYRRI